MWDWSDVDSIVKFHNLNKLYSQPDKYGHFGIFGGRYAPEVLMPALEEVEKAFLEMKDDPEFEKDFLNLTQNYSGRPTPLYFAENLTNHFGGAKIFIKREDLNHTGAHKITNALGQCLLVKRMGKKRIIAETGAGQHGVATATVAAKLGLKCRIYMGEEDIKRQRPNVFWMEQMGAEVFPVTEGTKTLKDAVNAALRDWITNVDDTHYLLGSALGPHPFPMMVRHFQSVIGREVKQQMQTQTGNLPDYCIACVGGGSNAIGLFTDFIEDESVELIGVEAGGTAIEDGKHAARFAGKNAKVGIFQGFKSYVLENEDGQVSHTSSVSAGLDYASVGPEHSLLRDMGRVKYTYVHDDEVIAALKLSMEKEGIIPALESAHAFAHAFKLAATLDKDKTIVVNQSGRGDKDIFIIAEALGDEKWKEFLREQSQL